MEEMRPRKSWSMAPFPKLAEATTPAQMRAAIEAVMFNHSLVHNTLRAARRDGLSAEDAYTMMAYHALVHHAAMASQLAELMALQPPRIIEPKKDGPFYG